MRAIGGGIQLTRHGSGLTTPLVLSSRCLQPLHCAVIPLVYWLGQHFEIVSSTNEKGN
jgi:hypothetical protein